MILPIISIIIISLFFNQLPKIASQETPNLELNFSGNITIGLPCERDYQCIEHAFCRVQMTCLCDPFYAPGTDGQLCHATSGTSCEIQENCSTMSNAECVQGVCTCKDNFILDMTNSSNCIIRPSKDGDLCQRADECIEALERANCINGKCKCFGDHRFTNVTGKCTQIKGIYQRCTHDYECYDETRPDALFCKDSKECDYKDSKAGYFEFSRNLIILQFIAVIILSMN